MVQMTDSKRCYNEVTKISRVKGMIWAQGKEVMEKEAGKTTKF